MRYVKFTIETDQDITGEIGIVPNTARNWEAYIPARALSHDLLDHSVKENGFYYQEMAALGGFTFRTNFGSHQPYRVHPYFSTLAWDLVSSLRDNQDIIEAPKYKLTNLEKARLNDLFIDMRPIAIESWESEYEWDSEENNFFKNDENWRMVWDWLSYGYARAKRRFKDQSWGAWILGERIDKVVEHVWPGLESWADSGREFTLAMDYDNAYAEVMGNY
jgi:hypothetical protein